MKTQAIIPSAGVGTRMEHNTPKPLIEIAGKPMIIHTLQAFEDCDAIDSIILVIHRDYAEEYKKAIDLHGIKKVKEFISGGALRGESISNALSYLDADTDMVVVHDGARPLVTVDLIERSIRMCINEKAVVTAMPVKPTIKRINLEEKTVERTLAREGLFEIQTPQVFHKNIFVDAYEQAASLEATDDAALVEQIGIKVKMMEGESRNIKVTTEEDLLVAEAFLNDRIKT